MRQVSVFLVSVGLCGALAGCSGTGKFFRDTGQFPGTNPNGVKGSSETLTEVRGQTASTAPLMPESGNVWPGEPKPFPTLQDVAAHPSDSMGYNPLAGSVGGGSGMGSGRGGGLAPGETMSMGGSDFSGGGNGDLSVPNTRNAPLPAMPKVPSVGVPSGASPSGKVVIPNGDGTETVISPDGTVSTVPVRR